MKLKELLHGLDVLELHADEDLDITGVQYDSRQATSGDLFVVVGTAAVGNGEKADDRHPGILHFA